MTTIPEVTHLLISLKLLFWTMQFAAVYVKLQITLVVDVITCNKMAFRVHDAINCQNVDCRKLQNNIKLCHFMISVSYQQGWSSNLDFAFTSPTHLCESVFACIMKVATICLHIVWVSCKWLLCACLTSVLHLLQRVRVWVIDIEKCVFIYNVCKKQIALVKLRLTSCKTFENPGHNLFYVLRL